jgi:fumarate reductase subunit D
MFTETDTDLDNRFPQLIWTPFGYAMVKNEKQKRRVELVHDTIGVLFLILLIAIPAILLHGLYRALTTIIETH